MATAPSRCDVLISGGTVIDGTGAPRRQADVAIRADRVVAIGALSDWHAEQTIDASGLIVAPGFIDAHTHDDRAVMANPGMAAKVSQGVTSVITGNCGIILAPLIDKVPPPPLTLLGDAECFKYGTMAAYMDAVDNNPGAVNVAMLVGHSTLRVGAMDRLDRAASEREIEQMGVKLDESMEAGCIGLSTGLAYPTAFSAPTEEVIALSARAAKFGGLYATHMRDEENFVTQSVDETVEIGRQSRARVVISHHKACGRMNWGRTRETLAQIDAANTAGQQVDFDVYPYIASSTVLLASFVARAERVMVTWSHAHPELKGQDLEDIRTGWDCSLDEAIERLQPAGAIYFQMDEEDLRRVLKHPGSMVGSDGLPHDEHPHPRLWGTFPRVLGHYSRDVGLFDLETAVYKMTGLSARVFGLPDRGVLRPDAFADVVLFNPLTVLDAADFNHPDVPAHGIEQVFVNGTAVWRNGSTTGQHPGRMLRRTN